MNCYYYYEAREILIPVDETTVIPCTRRQLGDWIEDGEIIIPVEGDEAEDIYFAARAGDEDWLDDEPEFDEQAIDREIMEAYEEYLGSLLSL